MHLTNRDELHPRWSNGPGPVTTTLATDALAPTQAAAARILTPRRCRCSGQRSRHSRVEWCWAARVAAQGGHASSHRHRNAVRGGTHGHKVTVPLWNAQCCRNVCLVRHHRHGCVRGPSGPPPIGGLEPHCYHHKSYHGSASEQPPATSHSYAEWDFSDVPDPVMFQRFLDVWTTSSAIPMTPTSEAMTLRVSASWSSSMNMPTAQTERVTEMRPKNQSRTHLPPRRWEERASLHSLPRHASSRLSSRRNTGRCGSCMPPS
jgi:hypothetical protein